jgi:hypothetical protein
MMLMAASWPSNSEAAVTKRSGVSSAAWWVTPMSEAGRAMIVSG